MSRFGIIVEVDRCVGCQACAIACKEENQVPPGVFFLKILRSENIEDNVVNYYRASCQHCDNPACMKICPAKAISKGPHGEILVDQKKCIGCHMCEKACPYGVPVFPSGVTSYYGDKKPLYERPLEAWTTHPAGKAAHCTLCSHRLEKGQLPACVEACGIHAITLVDYDKPTEKTKSLIEKAVAMNEAAGTQPKVRYIAKHMDCKTFKMKL